MRGRRWWVPVAFVLPFAVLAWAAATQSSVGTWLVGGAWAVLIVAMTVRAMRPAAREHRMRSGMGPALGGLGEVQDIYLGRPQLGPVAYGSEEPTGTQLIVDRAEPDPRDLGQPPHRA
jgi:hypothetical protein